MLPGLVWPGNAMLKLGSPNDLDKFQIRIHQMN